MQESSRCGCCRKRVSMSGEHSIKLYLFILVVICLSIYIYIKHTKCFLVLEECVTTEILLAPSLLRGFFSVLLLVVVVVVVVVVVAEVEAVVVAVVAEAETVRGEAVAAAAVGLSFVVCVVGLSPCLMSNLE